MTIKFEYFPNGCGEEMSREKNTRLVNYGGFFTFFFLIQTAAKDIVSNITRIHACACVCERVRVHKQNKLNYGFRSAVCTCIYRYNTCP